MPTDTFFRLPEEKRSRILESAWEEFTSAPYPDVSINRIIGHAAIPRGSFYQYFEDKNDLFFFLMDQSRSQFLSLFNEQLARAHGDVFEMMSGVFDALFEPDGAVTSDFRRVFTMFRLNASMDIPRIFLERPQGELGPFEQLVDGMKLSLLKSADPAYVGCVLSLLMSALGCAVAQTLQGVTPYDEVRAHLHSQLEIIKYGAFAASKGGKEE